MQENVNNKSMEQQIENTKLKIKDFKKIADILKSMGDDISSSDKVLLDAINSEIVIFENEVKQYENRFK